MQKMKSNAVKGIQIHNQREKESETNPDIVKEKSHLNYDLINGKNQIDYKEKIDQIISENVTSKKAIRKDAVRLSEFLITSDRDFFEGISSEEQERYFETAYEFLAERYGEKNLIYASVHLDEKTPHMHVGFVPVTEDGRLSAKDFFGQKKQLVSLQDDFNAHMKENEFDLKRGVSTSRKHVETAKYKALTFHNLEQEAKEKYEQTMNRIEAIDDNTKSIENIEAKKVLGLVGMKEQDYKTLVDYASNGALYKFQVEDLQAELEKTREEVAELKVEMQLGQDSIRYYYSDIQENFDKLVEEKSLEKMKDTDIVKNYNNLVTKYKSLAQKSNFVVDKFNEKLEENKELKQRVTDLTNENKDLKLENNSLKEKVLKISNELSAYKTRAVKALNSHFERIKNWLSMMNVDKEKIKLLEDKKEELAKHSLKAIYRPEPEKGSKLEL